MSFLQRDLLNMAVGFHREIVQKLADFSAFLSSKAQKWPSWDLVIQQ
jgi:hypothetical protein